MVALNSRPGEPSTGSSPDPARILAILDQAMQTPDVTVTRLRFLRYALEAGRLPDDYSDAEVAAIIDTTERTARAVKRWAWKWISPMYAVPHEVQTQEENSMPAGDAARQLAWEQLLAIGWGLRDDGRPIQEPDVLIEQYGALNVLYAIWCARGKQIRSAAGYTTWWLREGHQAPEGWLPVELRKTATENAQNDEDGLGALLPALEPQMLPEPKERPLEMPEPPQTPNGPATAPGGTVGPGRAPDASWFLSGLDRALGIGGDRRLESADPSGSGQLPRKMGQPAVRAAASTSEPGAGLRGLLRHLAAATTTETHLNPEPGLSAGPSAGLGRVHYARKKGDGRI